MSLADVGLRSDDGEREGPYQSVTVRYESGSVLDRVSPPGTLAEALWATFPRASTSELLLSPRPVQSQLRLKQTTLESGVPKVEAWETSYSVETIRS